MDEQELKALLIRDNQEFRKAFEDHQTCEKELARLRENAPVSEADALLEKDLKKKKLALKDRMYRIMSEHGKAR